MLSSYKSVQALAAVYAGLGMQAPSQMPLARPTVPVDAANRDAAEGVRVQGYPPHSDSSSAGGKPL